MVVLTAVEVGLGLWQLSRYHQRSATNARIEAAGQAAPVPLGQVLAVGQPPPAGAAWTRVTTSGRYDAQHALLARGRTASASAGLPRPVPPALAGGPAGP